MEDKEAKKINALMVVTIAIFLLTLGGATYAYLRNQNYGKETKSGVETLTNTTDSLTFNTTGDINIRANTENFEENMGNLSAIAVATATLLANNKTNASNMNYSAYININENDYEYSTTEKYPELLLQVIDPNGNEITEIYGLDYVVYKEEVRDSDTDEITQARVAGFDVTNKKGLFMLADNYRITVDETNVNHLTTQEWKVKVTLVNLDTDQEVNARKVFDMDVHIDKGANFVDYLKNRVSETLLFHDASLVNGASDRSYRYSGASANVENYVCFGSDAEICPANNLYRIIGLFDDDKDGKYEVKLVKNSSIGNLAWASSKTVNESYLLEYEKKWQDMIITHAWKVNGMSKENGYVSTAKTAYNYEVGSNSSSTTSKDKMGLIYVSDYYYAAILDYWTTKGENYGNAKESNWMYLETKEWTISPCPTWPGSVMLISNDGNVTASFTTNAFYAVRPTFYLDDNIYRISGSGTSLDPYRIS